MKFELNNLPRNCSVEEIIAEIKRVDKLVNKITLTESDYDYYGKISSSAIRKRLGNWQKVLALAGIENKYSGRKTNWRQRAQKLTDDEILDELKRIAKILNKEFITVEDLQSHSQIMWPPVVVRRFGSWAAGLEKAGLKVSDKYHRRYSNEEYFENLLNVWTHHGRQPLYREMDEHPSMISSGAYENRFGSWRKSLEAFITKMNEDEPVSKQVAQEEKPDAKQIKAVKREEVTKPKSRTSVGDKKGITLSLRYKILVRDKFKCSLCGNSPSVDPKCCLHVDHVYPDSKGGKTTLDNLRTLCKNCNLGKGSSVIEGQNGNQT